MSRVFGALTALSDGIDRVVRIATILTAGSFATLVFVSVLTRYVFSFPIIWSQEVSKLLFIWSAFLASTVAYRQKSHIRFEFINEMIGPRGTAITDALLYLAALVLFGIVFIHGIAFTKIVWPTVFPVIELSQGWLYVPVVATAVIFWIHSVRLLAESISELRTVRT